jgi:hypothetical protein
LVFLRRHVILYTTFRDQTPVRPKRLCEGKTGPWRIIGAGRNSFRRAVLRGFRERVPTIAMSVLHPRARRVSAPRFHSTRQPRLLKWSLTPQLSGEPPFTPGKSHD